MSTICFFPGAAAGRLTALAEKAGTSKADVLRELIAGAPMPAGETAGGEMVYTALTELGRRIREMAWKADEDALDIVANLAAQAEGMVAGLPDYGDTATAREVAHLADIHQAGGKAMTVRLGDMGARLMHLAARSGLGKAGTLRALIMDIPMPDRMAWTAYARAAQIGGLLRHIGYGYRNPRGGAWAIILKYGIAIGDRARAELAALAGRAAAVRELGRKQAQA